MGSGSQLPDFSFNLLPNQQERKLFQEHSYTHACLTNILKGLLIQTTFHIGILMLMPYCLGIIVIVSNHRPKYLTIKKSELMVSPD